MQYIDWHCTPAYSSASQLTVDVHAVTESTRISLLFLIAGAGETYRVYLYGHVAILCASIYV